MGLIDQKQRRPGLKWPPCCADTGPKLSLQPSVPFGALHQVPNRNLEALFGSLCRTWVDVPLP